MTIQTHTPKPWKAHGIMVQDTADTLGGMARIVMPGNQFAFCTNHADAKLIAAAPDLLFALQSLLCEFNSRTAMIESCDLDFAETEAIKAAENAIAKAGGNL